MIAICPSLDWEHFGASPAPAKSIGCLAGASRQISTNKTDMALTLTWTGYRTKFSGRCVRGAGLLLTGTFERMSFRSDKPAKSRLQTCPSHRLSLEALGQLGEIIRLLPPLAGSVDSTAEREYAVNRARTHLPDASSDDD
ncbi:hypothetical protein PM082_008767 [Marasmius tenuissimus]|nr:hypothetical protein PM082_008767 [Marasmius tenuissimus]